MLPQSDQAAPISVLQRYCQIFEVRLRTNCLLQLHKRNKEHARQDAHVLQALMLAVSLNPDIHALSVVDIFLSLDHEQLEDAKVSVKSQCISNY